MTTPTTPTPASPDVPVDEVLARLGEVVDAVANVDLDTLGDDQVTRLLAADERAIRRLHAHQSRLAATLTERRAAQARVERPDDARAPQRAARQVRGELTDTLGITPARAKQVARTGRQVRDLPATASAHAAGELTDQHVDVIAEVTAHFVGDPRQQVEAQLVDLAGRCRDAVVFGREARRLLIERDPDAAQADLDRKKAQRSGRVSQAPDGRTLLRLQSAGYAGELIHTAVDAFRTQDADGQHRTAEQRTHDAIVAALEAALRHGTAATQHGVRPHVALVVPAEAVRDGHGAVETDWTGPLPYREVARLLGDCTLTRLVADARGIPLSVSSRVRTVPAGLWQLLRVRDVTCIVDECDAPAAWCQVAHLGTPYHQDGRLSPDTAGLLCTSGGNHHALFDDSHGTVSWQDGRPVVRFTRGRTPDPAATSGPDEAADLPHPPTDPPSQPRLGGEARGTYDLGPLRSRRDGAGRRRCRESPAMARASP